MGRDSERGTDCSLSPPLKRVKVKDCKEDCNIETRTNSQNKGLEVIQGSRIIEEVKISMEVFSFLDLPSNTLIISGLNKLLRIDI